MLLFILPDYTTQVRILQLTGALSGMYCEMRLCSNETVAVPYPEKIKIKLVKMLLKGKEKLHEERCTHFHQA